MTTWSVVNDDTMESGPRRRYFRYAVFALAALLVLSLGFVLIPREPDAPAAPPFSEQARAAAFSDAVDLRALALASGEATEAARQEPMAAASQRAVTLLTVQARALMLPADKLPTDRSMAISSAPPSSAQEPQSSAAELATALHASGAQRLRDAEKADGGIARLLAGTGTAQLLAAEEMAAATGTALDSLPGRTVPAPAPASPALPSPAASSAESAAAGCTATATSGGADVASSFTSVARAELELVYAYQAALTRLPPASVAPASDFLTQHEDASREAEAAAGARCAALPPTPAGYALDAVFLADPAAALGVLEAGTLPVYGDLVALSDGAERSWALAALQSAARRAAHWGASPGPVPGMVLDASALPALPYPPQAPGIPATSSVP
ncbi:hypothetical protein GCM10009712_07040 [Pseudarthrobacter sulfonivorans]|uniref:DUF4439 domain-containing protein n=1 Tax=Pseudarthrobacter sulfonivorans TaxID=121292 RepID=UPI00295E4562|nr:DUF4439 domain-containing protein [Pseudarthrobacter sulfonivorans]